MMNMREIGISSLQIFLPPLSKYCSNKDGRMNKVYGHAKKTHPHEVVISSVADKMVITH